MSIPIDHHYLPKFYLKRWAAPDGQVCQFSRPYGATVKAKHVAPSSTAFQRSLYSMPSLPEDQAQSLETDFMTPLDTLAAEALTQLEKTEYGYTWSMKLRSAWSRFIWALMLRNPEDVAQIQKNAAILWAEIMDDVREEYSRTWEPGDPSTLEEYIAKTDPGSEDKFRSGLIRKLIDNPGICGTLNSFRWRVFDLTSGGLPLLTSDRPVVMTTTLKHPQAHVGIPIGPFKYFLAARSDDVFRNFEMYSRRQIAKNLNLELVGRANAFVYGKDDLMLRFVNSHMSEAREARPLERLSKLRNHPIVDSSSPA